MSTVMVPRASTSRENAGGERRRRLLAEFLWRKSANVAKQETSQEHAETEVQNDQVTFENEDLLFKILLLVPAESLVRLQFVCKKWFDLINSSIFIRFHVNAHQSEIVLISQKLTLLEPPSFPDLPPRHQDSKLIKSYFHLLDINNREMSNFVESSVVHLVDVLASRDGLILATTVDRNRKSLILMNPVTRKHTVLPLAPTDTNSGDESYGIAFCNERNTYKVVHLFSKKPPTGCSGGEILSIRTRRWIRIEGLPSKLLWYISQLVLVSIGGSLYWTPRRHNRDDFVSLNVKDGKFITKKLPAPCGLKDRLLDIGGSLGFVARTGLNLLQVWIMTNDIGGSREMNWVKRYGINLDVVGVGYPTPIYSSRNGKKMVLENRRHHLYVYDFGEDEMKLMVHSRDYDNDDEPLFGIIDGLYIPHRNTLASWANHC